MSEGLPPAGSSLSPGSYFGALLRSETVNSFILTENAYAPNQHVPPHEHERGFFYLVLDGTSRDMARGHERTCTPHTLVYHPPGETHSNSWDRTGGRCFHFELPPARLDLLDQRSSPLQRFDHYTGGLPVWLAARLYDEFRRPDAASVLAIEGLLLELVASVCRHAGSSEGRQLPKWLVSAREMILERCAEPLSVTEMAGEVGVHPTHFARAFRRAYGHSVGEFVRNARLERACKQLITGRYSVSRVAHDSGFYDQSHFSRTFKRKHGMTPSQFLNRFGPR